MNVPAPLVSMEPHAMMESISTHVYVLLALKGLTVRQTQMSVPVVLARTMERVQMVSLSTPVSVPMAMRATTVRQTQMSVPVTPVKMVANVQMVPMAILVHVHLDLKVSWSEYLCNSLKMGIKVCHPNPKVKTFKRNSKKKKRYT